MAQARTIAEALRIRHANYELLDRLDGPYGTAIGARDGRPVVQVFVERKIHENWLKPEDVVPRLLAHDGKSCATDVYQVGGELAAPYEPGPIAGARLDLRQRLRGGDPVLQPGSQLTFQDKSGGSGSGTLAAFARCRRTGKLGLLTNEHVGVFPGNVLTHPDADSPIVAKVTRSIHFVPAKQLWEGAIDDLNAHAILDCAFAELVEPNPPLRTEYPWIDGAGTIQRAAFGKARPIEINDPSLWPIGQQVFSVGRSRVDQTGTMRGVAFQYADGPYVSCYTDFLVTSTDEHQGGWFSWPGDSGKLVVTDDTAADPIGLLWGGSLLRTNPDLELIDHSFAASAFTVQEALEIDIVGGSAPS